MSRLSKGDVVLVKPPKYGNECIGLIKYIGPMSGHEITQYVGIELLSAIPHGHNGTVNNFKYFIAPKGYGYHTKITKVINKLTLKDLFIEMRSLQNSFESKLKYISKLEQMYSQNCGNRHEPTKIDTSLPSLSPSAKSTVSRSSYSKLELATPMTQYSTNSYTKMALKPYDSSMHSIQESQDKTIQNFEPQKMALQPFDSSMHPPIMRRKSSSSLSSRSLSVSECQSPVTPVAKPKKSRNKHKNKHRPKSHHAHSKHKHRPKHKQEPNKLSKSQSHQIPNNGVNYTRQRSKTNDFGQTQAQTQTRTVRDQMQMRHNSMMTSRATHLSEIPRNNRHNYVTDMQNRTGSVIYHTVNVPTINGSNVAHMPPTQQMVQSTPIFVTAQSAPVSPYINGIPMTMKVLHKKNNSPHFSLEQSNGMLPQSNTQMSEDVDITYNHNAYNTPSSGMSNTLMVNTAYSPYGTTHHHYDMSQSHSPMSGQFMQTTPTNNAYELSPYGQQFAAYEDYYQQMRRGSQNNNAQMRRGSHNNNAQMRRGSNMSNGSGGRLSPYNIGNKNKMYHLQLQQNHGQMYQPK